MSERSVVLDARKRDGFRQKPHAAQHRRPLLVVAASETNEPAIAGGNKHAGRRPILRLYIWQAAGGVGANMQGMAAPSAFTN